MDCCISRDDRTDRTIVESKHLISPAAKNQQPNPVERLQALDAENPIKNKTLILAEPDIRPDQRDSDQRQQRQLQSNKETRSDHQAFPIPGPDAWADLELKDLLDMPII